MIKIRDLHKIYNHNQENEFVALKNINLQISKGEVVILRGVSGSGKSTLLSILGALSHPSSGDVVVDNLNIAKLPDLHASRYRNSKIGFIFQSFNLINSLSVRDNVQAPLVISKEKNIDSLTQNALQIANISHKADELVQNLSGGEKQRTAIARAIVNTPAILIADEPTANLDHTNSLLFIESMRELKSSSKTIIIATHDPLFNDLDFVDHYIDIEDGEIHK